jgi:hypothetical protein
MDDPTITTVYLVGKRPSLKHQRPVYRWLARWLYRRMHWCPDWGIEYQGVFTSGAEARYVAGCDGGFVIALPLDVELPAEPCQYGVHDFPQSEASAFYRRREMPFTAVSHSQMKRLKQSLARTR